MEAATQRLPVNVQNVADTIPTKDVRPGDRFWALEIVERKSASSSGKHATALVRCDCGHEEERRISRIRSGESRACGWCIRRAAGGHLPPEIGTLIPNTWFRFQEMIRKPVGKHGQLTPFWRVQCTYNGCSRHTEVRVSSLFAPRPTRSCGCYNKTGYGGTHIRQAPGESGFRAVLRTYRDAARRRGLQWRLTEDEVRILTTMPCTYCGRPPAQVRDEKSQHGAYVYNGIDRVDNTVGYESPFVQTVPCCKRCNVMKANLTRDEFLDHCRTVASFTQA